MPPDGSTVTIAWLAATAGKPAGELRFDVAGCAPPCGYTCQYPGAPVTAVRLTATALAPAAPGTVKFRDSPARKVLTLRVSSTRVGRGERLEPAGRGGVGSRVVPEEVDDDIAAGAAEHVDHTVGTDRDGHEVRDRVPGERLQLVDVEVRRFGSRARVRPHGPVAGAGGARDREVEHGGHHRARRRQRSGAGDADRQRPTGRQGRREAGVDEPLRGGHRHEGTGGARRRCHRCRHGRRRDRRAGDDPAEYRHREKSPKTHVTRLEAHLPGAMFHCDQRRSCPLWGLQGHRDCR